MNFIERHSAQLEQGVPISGRLPIRTEKNGIVDPYVLWLEHLHLGVSDELVAKFHIMVQLEDKICLVI